MHPSFYITKTKVGKNGCTQRKVVDVLLSQKLTQRGKIDDIVNSVQPLEAVTIGGVKPDKNNYLLNILGAVSIQDKDALMPAKIKLVIRSSLHQLSFYRVTWKYTRMQLKKTLQLTGQGLQQSRMVQNHSRRCLSRYNHRKQGWPLQQSKGDMKLIDGDMSYKVDGIDYIRVM